MHAGPVPSQGTAPCSLSVSGEILYVVNQHIRSSAGKAEPSLAVFALDGDDVRHLPGSSFKLRRGESPTQAIANPQGTVLAIPSVRARVSLLHAYAIDPAAAGKAGLLTEFENSPFGITDTGYGFGSVWKADGKTFFMTNAIGVGSVVRLTVDAASRRITEKARFTTPGNACWSALSRDGKRLYVANLLSLLVFDVSGGGLTQLQSLDVKDVPKPVLRDLILGPGGRFLYAIEQRKRRILTYAVGKDGRVALQGELALKVPGYTLGLASGEEREGRRRGQTRAPSGAVNLASSTLPVLRVPRRLEEEDLHLLVGHRPMLDPLGDHQQVAGPHLDHPVPELDPEAPPVGEEHLVHLVVAVPDEGTLDLDRFDLLAVQLGHHLRAPALVDLGELFREGDLLDRHPLQ